MLLRSLKFGWKCLCPCCGKSRLYETWAKLIVRCPHCQTPIQKHEDDTWFFMYMSTAFITGLFIVAMFVVSPTDPFAGRWVVAIGALIAIVGTVHRRKGLALALDWWLRYRYTDRQTPS